MTTILLARHGQASFGQENYDALSALGQQQAKMLGQHYATTQRQIDAIFTGSLVRQRDSARHFWQSYQSATDDNGDTSLSPVINIDAPESHIIPQFDEFDHKEVFLKSDPAFIHQAAIDKALAQSDTPKARLAELFDVAMQRWHAGDNDDDYLESWPQFSTRAHQALEHIRERVANLNLDHHGTVLVFTSGGVIAAITAQLLQQSSQTAYQLNKILVNTGVTSVTLKDQRTRLMSFNEYSHLFAEGKNFITWR